MAKKFSELRARLSPEVQARAALRTQELLVEGTLAEVRTLREVTQARLAEILQISQGAVSRIEGREDTYISTVRSYVEAMGGTLELVAKFNDTLIKIVSLSDRQRAAPSSITNAGSALSSAWAALSAAHHGVITLNLDSAMVKVVETPDVVARGTYAALSKFLKAPPAPARRNRTHSRAEHRSRDAGTNMTQLKVSIQ